MHPPDLLRTRNNRLRSKKHNHPTMTSVIRDQTISEIPFRREGSCRVCKQSLGSLVVFGDVPPEAVEAHKDCDMSGGPVCRTCFLRELVVCNFHRFTCGHRISTVRYGYSRFCTRAIGGEQELARMRLRKMQFPRVQGGPMFCPHGLKEDCSCRDCYCRDCVALAPPQTVSKFHLVFQHLLQLSSKDFPQSSWDEALFRHLGKVRLFDNKGNPADTTEDHQRRSELLQCCEEFLGRLMTLEEEWYLWLLVNSYTGKYSQPEDTQKKDSSLRWVNETRRAKSRAKSQRDNTPIDPKVLEKFIEDIYAESHRLFTVDMVHLDDELQELLYTKLSTWVERDPKDIGGKWAEDTAREEYLLFEVHKAHAE